MNYPPGPPFGPPRPGMPPPGYGGMHPMFPPPNGMPGAPPLGMHMPPRGPILARPPLPMRPMGPPIMPTGSLQRPPPVRGPTVAQTPPAAGPAAKSTTVYVGKIAVTIADKDIKALLDACGPVKSWKPMLDPDTQKSKGFGFCEYEEIEGVVRALKLLQNLKVDGQELHLKCTSGTQRYIDEYQAQKQQKLKERESEKEDGETLERNEEDIADDQALGVIMEILSKRAASANTPTAVDHASKFLSSLNGNSSVASDAKEEGGERHRRSRDKDDRERARESDKELERERERLKREEELKREEQERMYRERVREWERYERERVKQLELEKERDRELEYERLRQVKADVDEYATDDDSEEWRRKSYRSSRRYVDRRRRRAREEEEDELDRIKEAKERKRQRVSHDRQDQDHGGSKTPTPSPAPDATPSPLPTARAPSAASEPSADVDPNDPIYRAMMNAAKATPRVPSPAPAPIPAAPRAPSATPSEPPARRPEAPAHSRESAHAEVVDRPPARTSAPSKKKVLSVFGDDEEEDKPKRKLIPIQYSEEEVKALKSGGQRGGEADEKAVIKGIIDRIPTTKDDVFAYKINWGAFDAAQPALSSSLTQWTNKKIKDLLGEEEKTLVEFIMDKLTSHSNAPVMHEELQNVLDEEAETFVLKLYRTVIFETERYAVLGS